MSKIAIVYWTGTGNTETMAGAVLEGALQAGANAVLLTVDQFSAAQMDDYDAVAFGCPAMGAEACRRCGDRIRQRHGQRRPRRQRTGRLQKARRRALSPDTVLTASKKREINAKESGSFGSRSPLRSRPKFRLSQTASDRWLQKLNHHCHINHPDV